MKALDTSPWRDKIVGIMQSAADKTIQIAYDGNVFTFTGGSLEQPFVINKLVFSSLTVHEILHKAGIEINPQAGK